MKVLISVFGNLYTDQRVEKVCRTLHENTYDVELIGNSWGGLPEMSRPYPFSRIQINSKNLRFAYPEFNWKLYRELLKKADKETILLSNDLDTLLPNYLVSKKLKIPLVFDSHEIFTEMPAIQGRFTQKIWRALEKKILPKVQYMMTESESYASWFRKQYKVSPTVIRNIPRRITTAIEIPENNPKIILYQGVINPSRGISQAILAMKFLENGLFKIAGNGPKFEEYKALVKKENLQEKVHFLGLLHPDELRKVTRTADVGLSIEENNGVSYLYSFPNKVSDYIQSRVPVVMINFPEMQRIKRKFDIGEITESHHPEILAENIQKVLEKGRKAYQPELERASAELCWEKEENKILELFQLVKNENFI